MKVTMQQIGQTLGVSKVTVSKALSGQSGVSEAMRKKIRSKAAELGYKGAKEERSLNVGVLIPNRFFDTNSFYSMLYRMLVEELSRAGCFALLELLDDEAEKKNLLPNLIRSGKTDVIIVMGQPCKQYVRTIACGDTPVIFLDFYDEDAAADAVVGDSTYGSYRLTNHLIKEGHKCIGFVGEPLATSSIMDRYLGFFRAMMSNGLTVSPEWIIPDRETYDSRIKISLPERLPTAFVCCCDLTACEVIRLLGERGLRVPEDVSVMGFDDFCTEKPTVPLSTFRVNYEQMIKQTVQLTRTKADGVRTAGGRIVIGGTPVYRESDKPLK